MHAEIETTSWSQGPVFDWLADSGNIETAEMRRTFNCGVGMVVVVDAASADETIAILRGQGEDAWLIGRMADGPGEVHFL